MIVIDHMACDLCGTCVGVCPAMALMISFETLTMDQERCTGCKACSCVCPVEALEYVDE